MEADPDWDRMPNLLEYAFGLDPRSAQVGGSAAPVAELRVDPETSLSHLAVTFDRPQGIGAHAIFRMQKSSDLRSWTDVSAEEEIVSENELRQTIRLTDAEADDGLSAKLFVRIQVALVGE